jgi:hypothetical protein
MSGALSPFTAFCSDGSFLRSSISKTFFLPTLGHQMAQFVMAAYYILWWLFDSTRIQRENGFVVRRMVNPQEGMVRSIYPVLFLVHLCVSCCAMLVQQLIHGCGAQNRSRSSVDWSPARKKSVTWNARQPHGVLTCVIKSIMILGVFLMLFAMPVGTDQKMSCA